jgi:hypothetical protein
MKKAKELLAQELVLKELAIKNKYSELLNLININSNIIYSTLNRDKQEIRFFTLCSSGFKNEIHCKFDIILLDKILIYIILLYCWGN